MNLIRAVWFYVILTEKSTRDFLTDEEKITLLKSHMRLRGFPVWKSHGGFGTHVCPWSDKKCGRKLETLGKLFKNFLPDTYITDGPGHFPEGCGTLVVYIWPKDDPHYQSLLRAAR